MATYRISGVWFSETPKRHISSVNLHSQYTDGVGRGSKATKDYVVNLINTGNTVTTMQWNYATARWKFGAVVEVITVNGVNYLRTVRDATVSDNLENMINMDWL